MSELKVTITAACQDCNGKVTTKILGLGDWERTKLYIEGWAQEHLCTEQEEPVK